MTVALVERMASEDLWILFQRVVPPSPVCPQGGGHRRRGDREVLAAIIFVAASGCTWNQLPTGLGLSGATAFPRFTERVETRVWARLHRLVLDELGTRGELDWSRCAINTPPVLTDRRARRTASDSTAYCRFHEIAGRLENRTAQRTRLRGPAPADTAGVVTLKDV